jgi:hypothetical protein
MKERLERRYGAKSVVSRDRNGSDIFVERL